MIIEYHRPETLESALALLGRPAPRTIPLGGGTGISRYKGDPVAVVDLQKLSLDSLDYQAKQMELGGAVKLHDWAVNPQTPDLLHHLIEKEGTYNLRQMATIGGMLASSDGRSALLTMLLALDTRLVWLPGEKEVSLGDWLPLRGKKNPGSLISKVLVPSQVIMKYDSVSRTPEDLPIVCVAVARWSSGRTRVALGGYGTMPLLAMDGPEASGALEAVRNAYSDANDQWASAEYRLDAASTLVQRLLAE